MNQFALDRRNGVLLVTFAGPLTQKNLDAYNDELRGFVAREGTMATIVDLTGVPSASAESSALVSRGRLPSLMPGKPRVFVVGDAAMYGLLRVYAAHQEANGETPPRIVRSLAEAFKALSLTDPAFEPIDGAGAGAR